MAAQLQCSCLENPMDGGAWWAAVQGVIKSLTRLSDFTFTFMRWRRKWQPTPVFLPGESQGRESLVGCRLWGRTESDTTEATQQQQQGFHLQKQWPLLMGSMQSFVHLYCSVEWGGSCTSKKKKKLLSQHPGQQSHHFKHPQFPPYPLQGPCLQSFW